MRASPRWLVLAAGLAVGLGAAAHEIEIGDEEAGSDAVLADVPCVEGNADRFRCWNIDLLAWIPTGVFGQGPGNDIWGWTDPRTGAEIAIIGLRGGVAFVDVSEPHHPEYLGLLPTQTAASIWNDVKVYRDHAFVVSEAAGHGMQIFDLTELDAVVDPPVLLAPTAHYAGFGNAHNLALDEETGFAFAVGTTTCRGGLHMVDVSRPLEPVFAGCFGDDRYTHDAQCVVYHGPDAALRGRELCFNSNEDTLTIVDVTSKDAPRMLARRGYAGRGYTHQGWLTEDHAYFLLGDELDELSFGHRMRTYVWDVSQPEAPFLAGAYTGTRGATDHNLFVRGNHVFEANYRAGLRVLRMGDLSRAELTEVAWFDTFPEGNGPGFDGAWGVYPFFGSGTLLVSDIDRGLFVLAADLAAVPECDDGIDNDRDGLTDHPDDPGCADAAGARELLRTDVAIDVRAAVKSDGNRRERGVVPVAVLGSADFDVASIDPSTLRFGPGGAPPAQEPRRGDIDADGSDDLDALYELRDAALPEGAAEACLRWETWDGTPYRGCDALRRTPPDAPSAGAGCGDGYALALALLPFAGLHRPRRG